MMEKFDKQDQSEGKYNPSPEWNEEDRVNGVLHIIDEMVTTAQAGKLTTPQQLFDFSQRLRLLVTMSPKFLEASKNQILTGGPDSPPSSRGL